MNLDPVNTVLNDKFFDIKYFNPAYLFDKMAELYHLITPFVFREENLNGFKLVLSLLVVFFAIIAAYSAIRILEIRRKEHHHLQEEIKEYAHHQAERNKKEQNQEEYKNERWKNVLIHVFSPNVSDWRLAIIEADSMLDTLLSQLGFRGETMGDRLKSADPEKFRSLSIAWEVHTVRNKIAHEGSNFEISQQEAKRIIALYEQIFREFGFI